MTLSAWMHRLFARKSPTSDGLVVSDRSLQKVLAGTTRVEIRLGGVVAGRCLSEEIAFATDLPGDIQALREALHVRDGSAGHCMCHGDAGILLFDPVGNQVAAIGVHHGDAIRWDHWTDDAPLVDGWRLIDWLIDHGVAYPLNGDQIRERSLGEIGGFLGSALLRVDRAIYATADRATWVTVGVSPRYPGALFHFAFRADQQAALHGAARAYAAFVCGSPYRTLLVPFAELSSWLAVLRPTTVNGGSSCWPIFVRESPSGLALEGLPAGQAIDLQPFLLARRA